MRRAITVLVWFLVALVIIGAIVWLIPVPAPAQPTDTEALVLVGRVDRLLDGDTFDVLLDGDEKTTRIRMQGIDAPETDQPMSDDAVALLRVLLGDGEVELQPAGQTSYTRMVARVYVGDVDVNAQMVQRGLAMAERRYLRESQASDCTEAVF